jgi:probable rRNA maturation factor
MAIYFKQEGVKRPAISSRKLAAWLTGVTHQYAKKLGSLNYIFCDDEYLLAINKQYLNHDYYTDIITFDYSEGNKVSGDLFISIDRVKENAILFKVSYEDELFRVLVHGLLHLIGFTDKSAESKKVMRALEDEFILIYKNSL